MDNEKLLEEAQFDVVERMFDGWSIMQYEVTVCGRRMRSGMCTSYSHDHPQDRQMRVEDLKKNAIKILATIDRKKRQDVIHGPGPDGFVRVDLYACS